MSKTWSASITVGLGELSADEIAENPKRYGPYFKDLNNPTDAEVQAYFESRQENYAGSNDGSELIANSPIDIETSEE